MSRYVPRRHRVQRAETAYRRLIEAMTVRHTSADALAEMEAPMIERLNALRAAFTEGLMLAEDTYFRP